MLGSNFETYGIKEVADITIYEVNQITREEKPILFLDSLKITNLEQVTQKSIATGGKGGAPLIIWYSSKDIILNVTDAVCSFKSLALFYGAQAFSELISTKLKLARQIYVPETAATLFDLIEASPAICQPGTELIIPGSWDFFNQKGVQITEETVIDNVGLKILGIWTSTEEAIITNTIKINPRNFSKSYKIVGDTYIRQRANDKDIPFRFIINWAKIKMDNILTLTADGEPMVFNFQIIVKKSLNKEMMELLPATAPEEIVFLNQNYTIIFNGMNAELGTMPNQTMVRDTFSPLYACLFSKTGYSFEGWAIEEEGELIYEDQAVVKNLAPTDEVITLYAIWAINSYSIDFDIGVIEEGGVQGTAPTSIIGVYNTAIDLPDSTGFSWGDRIFYGWATSNNPNVRLSSPYTIPASDQTLQPVWGADYTELNLAMMQIPDNDGGLIDIDFDYLNNAYVATGVNNLEDYITEQISYELKQYQQDTINIYRDEVLLLIEALVLRSTVITITFDLNPPDGETVEGNLPEPITAFINEEISLPSIEGIHIENRTPYGWNTTNNAITWIEAPYYMPNTSTTLYLVYGANYENVLAEADLADNTTLPVNAAHDPGYLPGGEWYEAAGFTNNGYYSRVMFTPASIAALESAVNAVNYTKMRNQQITVDGYATAITNAYNNLELAVADYAPMQAKVAYVGTLTGTNYTVSSWYAVTDAVAVANDYIASQYKAPLQPFIDEVYDSLVSAINALVWRPADYSGVYAAWNSRPTDMSIYTTESVAALNAYYAAINGNLTLENDGQATVNGYATGIYNLISALVLKPADYTGVNNAIISIPDNDEGAMAVDAAYLRTIYTDTSVTNLVLAVNAVDWNLNKLQQDAVNTYAVNINTARNALVPLGANYTYLDLALDLVPAWPSSYYTDPSYTAYNNARIAGGAVPRDLDRSEQQQIDDAVSLIDNTYSDLVLKPVTYTVKYQDASENTLSADVVHDATAADLITENAISISGYTPINAQIQQRLTGTSSSNIFLFIYNIS